MSALTLENDRKRKESYRRKGEETAEEAILCNNFRKFYGSTAMKEHNTTNPLIFNIPIQFKNLLQPRYFTQKGIQLVLDSKVAKLKYNTHFLDDAQTAFDLLIKSEIGGSTSLSSSSTSTTATGNAAKKRKLAPSYQSFLDDINANLVFLLNNLMREIIG